MKYIHLLLVFWNISWACHFLIDLQDIVAKLYPTRLSMTTLMCFLATLQSAVITLIFERNVAHSTLKWNNQLLSVVYAVCVYMLFPFINCCSEWIQLSFWHLYFYNMQGVMISGAVYYMQIWCMSKNGPVFVAMFSPVSLIAVSVLSFFIFSERLQLGMWAWHLYLI